MRILVSGAAGFLGRAVVDRLLQRGHEVRAIVRPSSPVPPWPGEVDIFRADLRNHNDLSSAFDGIDAVLHLAAATSGSEDVQFASTVAATERFLDAMAKSSVKRLIHVSSLAVYDWAHATSVLDEGTPLLGASVFDMGGYTIAKVWQERVVARYARTYSWDLTVMRPGFIWGAQHEQIAGMGRRFGRIYLIFGPFTRLPLTHVRNCSDCLVAAIERAPTGESFNVIDSDNVRVWRYVREYIKRTGKSGFMLPLPYRLGLGLAYVASWVSQMFFGKRGKLPSLLVPRRFESQFKPVRFSNRKLLEKMQWKPPLSFAECISETYRKR